MSRAVVGLFSVVAIAALVAACGGNKAASAPAAPAGQAGAVNPNAFTGTVAETMNSGGYTYARLQSPGKEDVWIASSEFPARTGDQLSVGLEMPMQNFESKTLKRTFPLIYFVASVSRDGQPLVGSPAQGGGANLSMMTSHAPASSPTTVEPLAPPAGGLPIGDLWAQRASFNGKEVTVRGKVVKVNTAILDRNWIHLQDGSGSAGDGTNDITVTTDADVTLGDTVTITGVLAVGKDFGAGYSYQAIIENAKVVGK